MMQHKAKRIYNLKIEAIVLALFLLISIPSIAQSDSLLTGGQKVRMKPTAKFFSPHKASLFSAVLPGMGQIYNRKYWKAPLVWGALGSAIYALSFNQKYYTTYKNAYRDHILQDPANTSYEQILKDNDILIKDNANGLYLRDFQPGGSKSQWLRNTLNNRKLYYKKYRDYSYVAIGIIYVLNIVDAAVDAHFKQFDISDDLTLRWEPVCTPHPIYGATYGFGINLTFK